VPVSRRVLTVLVAAAAVAASAVGLSPGPSRAAEDPGWEQPLETSQQPPVFDGFGPAVATEGVNTQAVGEAKVAPLLGRAAWSWYQDPRAIEDRGHTTVGAIGSNGDIEVVQVRNSDGRLTRFTLAKHFPVIDDHNAPALMRTASGRYVAMWSGHGLTRTYLRVSTKPNSITSWGKERGLAGSGLEHARASYAVLFRVPQQVNQYVAMVRRSSDELWVMTTSRDLKHWTKAFALVGALYPVGPDKREQPYLKFAYDGATLHVIATDRQPNFAGSNKLYHFTIADGLVRRSDGIVVDTLADVQAGHPIDLRLTSLVYDGAGVDGEARLYDVAVVNHEPIIAITTTAPGARAYKWARFRDGGWQLRTLVRQSSTPQGMTLDSEDPRNVYLSYAPPGSRGRIVRLVTPDDGETWTESEVGDHPDSRTPTTPAGSGGTWDALWLRGPYTSRLQFRTTVTGLTRGPRPLFLSASWGSGWAIGKGTVLVTARQGYTTVAAAGVTIRMLVTTHGRTVTHTIGTTNSQGALKYRFGSKVRPGSSVRFVVKRTGVWGAASTSSRRAP
jgi:hypothetical protein